MRSCTPYVLFAILFFTACETHDEVNESRIENEIRQALQAQKDAWNEGDLDGFVSWYIDGNELRFTTSRGMIKGSNGLLERYREAYPDKSGMGTLDFEILEFKTIDSQNAVMIGRWLLLRDGDRPEGYFTLIWRLTDNGWRIAIDHTS